MHHLVITECRIRPGMMQRFVSIVQGWEQDAFADAAGPERHGVYVASRDPAAVLVVTQFADEERARSFAATGRLETFLERITPCVSEPPVTRDGFDLFYGRAAGGPTVVFGEDTGPDRTV